MANFLLQRGRQWYFRIKIPAAARHQFKSKHGRELEHIVEPIGTDYAAARVVAARCHAAYLGLFERMRQGEKFTPDQIKAIVSFDISDALARIRQESREDFLRKEALSRAEWDRPPTAEEEAAERAERAARLESVADDVAKVLKGSGIERGTAAWGDVAERVLREQHRGRMDVLRERMEARAAKGSAIAIATLAKFTGAAAPAPTGETITQALDAWLTELQSDEATKIRPDTIKGHHGRVQSFVDKFTDLPLTSITRETASGFLSSLKCKNQTKNQYAMTLKAIVECARRRGRFPKNEDNPFNGQRRKFERTERDRFTDDEVRILIDAFGPRDINPSKHSPQTALPWVVAIAAHSGACLEEICQLAVADIQTEGGNGSTVTVFDIHNGDGDHKLKNDETRPRKVPVHSELVRAGFLDYVKALPQDGLVFPGFTRRASKDNKIGSWVGRLFNKRREALGIKRDDMLLDFHSWRTTAATKMDEAGIPESHMNEVLGHAQKTETTRTYSKGPGIHNLKVAVEAIRYPGLELH